jgi:glycosyltransferase involved in cell wall biosynthesis
MTTGEREAKVQEMAERPLSGIKVTLVGSGIHEQLSGGARIGGLVRILVGKGASVNLVSFLPYADDFSIAGDRTSDCVTSLVLRLPARLNRAVKGLLLSLFVIAGVLKFSRASDVMWTSCGSTLSNLPAVFASKLCRKPLIYDFLDLEIEVPERLTRLVLRRTSAVFACSHYLADKARGYGCANVFYIPCFVDPRIFRFDEHIRVRTRKGWSVRDDETIIGYAGVLARGEGVGVLLQAFGILRSKHENVRLAILGVKRKTIGAWDDVQDLSKQLSVEQSVILTPPMPHSEVPGFLSACDILVAPKLRIPSNSATIPIKLVEYLSMGLPTITTSFGEEDVVLVKNGVDGFVARPDDPSSLADVIEYVMTNPKSAGEVARRGPSRVSGEFTSEAVGWTIVEALRTMLGAKKDGNHLRMF